MTETMIARNFRKYPEALALQLVLQFACVVVRKIRERHSSSLDPCRVRPPQLCQEAEEIPVGSTIQTPSGRRAQVLGYKGYGTRGGPGRDHRVRLHCRYLDPVNKKFDYVTILPELVTVVEMAGGVR